MKREPRWIPRLVINAVHVDQIREHGGLPGVRDEDGLEAALARARNKWNYDGDCDWADLAAAYAFAIARSHPFNDGNKRTAFLAAMVFLRMNGKDLDVTEPEVVQVIVTLAAGKLAEDALAEWLRGRIIKAAT